MCSATKTWNTISDNARASHAAMDGETVDIQDVFSNGLDYPGDPTGDAAETAGCDCTVDIEVTAPDDDGGGGLFGGEGGYSVDNPDMTGLSNPQVDSSLGQISTAEKHDVLDAVNEQYPVAGVNEVLSTPSAMTEAVRVPISDLTSMADTSHTLYSDTVKSYIKDLQDGKELDPGLAVKMDGKTYLVDGNHRTEALIRTGHEDVPVRFVKGVGGDAPTGQSFRDILDATDQKSPLPEDLITKINGEYGSGGLRVEIGDNSYVTDAVIQLRGKIYAPDGTRAGRFVRRISREAAEHEELQIDSQYQAQGFASAFNAKLEQMYAEAGIPQVELHANLDVGGFAWARRGFDWADKEAAQTLRARLQAVITSAKIFYGKPELIQAATASSETFVQAAAQLAEDPAALAEAESIVARMGGTFGSADFPTPFEFSNIGYSRDVAFWPGKNILLGSGWNGVKVL
jgi:hypothetical protein